MLASYSTIKIYYRPCPIFPTPAPQDEINPTIDSYAIEAAFI